MQQLFKKVAMITFLVGFQATLANKFDNEPGLKAAAEDIFMQSMMYRKIPNEPDLYINCGDLVTVHRHADALGIARQDIAFLARRAALELRNTLQIKTINKKEWTEEDINALANAIRIRNLVLFCPNR